METPFDLDHDFDAGVETTLSYLICSVPRSGSYLLCELLWRSGVAGAPEELFHPVLMPHVMQRWGVTDLDSYLGALLEHKTSPNGVFGAKMHLGQYLHVLGDRDIETLFPNSRFIRITRADRLRQAVSFVRAAQTLQWRSSQQARRPERYDAAEIQARLERLERVEQRWIDLFESRGIDAYHVEYERLAEQPAETLKGVLDWLGIEAPAGALDFEPSLRRQSDEVSDEWVRRFLAEAPPR